MSRSRSYVLIGVLTAASLLGAVVLFTAGDDEEQAIASPGPAPTSPPVTAPLSTTTVTTPNSTDPPGTGSLETRLGPVDWTHLTGTAGSLPYPDGGVVAVTSGFLAISHEPDSSGTDFSFWRSPDGYRWARESLPVPVSAERARILELQDEAWLITPNPDTLWRSSGVATWTEVTVPAGAVLDRDSLVEADGIWLMGSSLWRLDDSTWAEIDDDPPWSSYSGTPIDEQTDRALVALEEGLAAYVLNPNTRPGVTFWTSPNGRDWSDPVTELRDDWPPARFRFILARDGAVVGVAEEGNDWTRVWVSRQGEEWVWGHGNTGLPNFLPLDEGAILLDEVGGNIWVSEDLNDWGVRRVGFPWHRC